MQQINNKTKDSNYRIHPVRIWLSGLGLLVIAMVAVGGITRLTQSGLSIVEWKPIMGATPPLSHADWTEVFAKYQKTPEFLIKNSTMSLAEFQWIFFWEYIHRLIGRLLGVVFLIPWVYFILKKTLKGKWIFKPLVGFLLGGAQGALGWYMVKSGLVDQPHVSPFRLAAHLLLALAILVYFVQLQFQWQLTENKKEDLPLSIPFSRQRLLLVWISLLVVVQIFYGALTAGFKAGFFLNTFPTMGGLWIPNGWNNITPLWHNLFLNPICIQWIHRLMAWLILAITSIYWVSSAKNAKQNFLMVAIVTQFILGASTLVLSVPVALGTLHQVGATIVLVALVSAFYANKIVTQKN